jgi:hypothetical protein
MKTLRVPCSLVVLLLSLIAFTSSISAPVAQAAGASTLHFSFKGLFAEATFHSTDSSGCIVTNVFLGAVNDTIKQTGHPEQESMAGMFIGQSDLCKGAQLIDANGLASPLAADAFQINPHLTQATLNTTIEVFDLVSETSFPVNVSMSWTGSGPTSPIKEHFHLKSPGLKVNQHLEGIFRNATASGSATAAGTNFTPEPVVSANMESDKSGDVTITHS